MSSQTLPLLAIQLCLPKWRCLRIVTPKPLFLGPREIWVGKTDLASTSVIILWSVGRIQNPLEYYYQDFSEGYRAPDGVLGGEPYNIACMDRFFSKSLGTQYPSARVHPQITSSYTATQIDDTVKAFSHFDDRFELKWPDPHERIYNRPPGGM